MARKHSLHDQLHHEEQQRSYKRMRARGFKPNDIERGSCVSLCKIEDGFLLKVRIDRNGRVQQYSPTKATIRDEQLFA